MDSTIGFYPDSAIRKMTHGNGLTATWAFNNSLQPCRYNTNSSGTALGTCADAIPSGSVQDFNLGFSAGTADNGNMASMTAAGTQNFSRSFNYDSLNRLFTMGDSNTSQACRGLQWTYDAWGNRTAQSVTAGTCGTSSVTVNTNNQLVGPPYLYDAAGNVTADGNHTYLYDAENRVIRVDAGSTAGYVYDAAGRRVRKTISPLSKDYVFNLASNVVAEIAPTRGWQVGYNYLNGQLQSEYTNNTTYFIHGDHLGSARLLTGMNQAVVQNLDYLPFGENNSTDSGISTHEFTGDERDAESSLDHTQFRQYTSQLGRWISPDRIRGSIRNPQTLNRYTYVLNNPVNAFDPLGLTGYSLQCPPTNRGPICVSSSGGGDCTGGAMCQFNGNDIFDAIAGMPGTYLSFNMYGQLSFGFSHDLYVITQNVIDAMTDDLRGKGFPTDIIPTNGYQVVVDISGEYGLIPDLLSIKHEAGYLGRTFPKQFAEMLASLLTVPGADPRAAMQFVLEQMNSQPVGRQWLSQLNDLFQQVAGVRNQFLNMFGQPAVKAPPLDLLIFFPQTIGLP